MALRRAGLHEDISHTVELLVTEVVTNALRHGGAHGHRIVLLATLQDDFARVEVADPGPGFDAGTARRGLGLRLLDALASTWSAARTGRGNLVTFEVDRRPAAAGRPSATGRAE